MAPLSEITKCQIQGLRNHLQYIDNQMANSGHHPNEAFMNAQRNAVQAQIGNMELMLQTQLAQENVTNTGRQGEESKPAARNSSGLVIQEKKVVLASGSKVSAALSKQISTTSTEAVVDEQTVKPDKTQGKQKTNDTRATSRLEPTNKSRLTAAAAMAPPFQPRAQTTTIQPSQAQPSMELVSVISNSPVEDVGFETQAQIENRLLSKASTNWSQKPGVGGAPASLPRTHSMQEPPHRKPQPVSLPRSSTFHGQTDFIPTGMAPIISAQPVPYLVGVLPQGIRNTEAKATDLVYPRPLTDEEIRARHLYWGNAPRSVQKGLPKFDGKDFYPPSPVKEFVRIATSSGNVSANGDFVSTNAPLPDFEKLFTEPGVPGYKTPSPARLSASHLSLVSIPAQQYINGPSLSIQEVAEYHSWPTQSPRREEHDQHPVTPPRLGETTNISDSDDFSHLFLERGVPGYKSPSPPHPTLSQLRTGFESAQTEMPVTPKNSETFEDAEVDNDDTQTVDSWGLPATEARWNPEKGCAASTSEDARIDEQSNDSTIEIHLSPRDRDTSPKPDLDGSFAERVASFSNVEQQTLFLQNMLKNTAQTNRAMTGSVLSGAVSSATATGYLPQYRGTAVASLAPTILNVSVVDRDTERPATKPDFTPENMNAGAPLISANFLPENRPFNLERPSRSTHPSPDSLGAEGYMRFLTQKADEDKKTVEQGWNASTTGTGSFPGSNW